MSPPSSWPLEPSMAVLIPLLFPVWLVVLSTTLKKKFLIINNDHSLAYKEPFMDYRHQHLCQDQTAAASLPMLLQRTLQTIVIASSLWGSWGVEASLRFIHNLHFTSCCLNRPFQTCSEIYSPTVIALPVYT